MFREGEGRALRCSDPLFRGRDGFLAEQAHQLADVQGFLAGAHAGGLVTFLTLEGGVFLEGVDVGVDVL